MRYEGNIFRPPGEWKSYLLQCTVGCSHNACTFCGMYKDKSYHVKDLDFVLEDIKMASTAYPDTETVFLCDGDAINLPVDYLLTVLSALKSAFPRLRRVTSYAGPRSTMRKTPEELKLIHNAGLDRVYLGVETGDSEVLLKRGKGVNAEQMLQAGTMLREAGYDLWATIMIGIAGSGVQAWIRNSELTAKIINEMAPNHLSAMTYMPLPDTPMYWEIVNGDFIVQSPKESLLEMRNLLQHITLSGLHFTANHGSNYMPIKGTVSEDTPELVELINCFLEQENLKLRRTDYRHM